MPAKHYPKKIRMGFGSQAIEYSKYRVSHGPKVAKMLFELVPKKPLKILDIGCGTGKSTEPLVSKNTTVYGLDPDKRMLSVAKTNALKKDLPIIYKTGSAESIPFKENTFDIVHAGNAFHWFTNKKALASISKVLKPGGIFFVYWSEIGREDQKLRQNIFSEFYKNYKISATMLKPGEGINFLKTAGFKNVKHTSHAYYSKNDLVSGVGRLKTIGSYFKLTEKQKLQFEGIAQGIIGKHLGRKKTFMLVQKRHICYGFKKK